MSVNTIVYQEEEDQDQDSLFGSPPPTPIRGRSPSPGLALPNASSSTQNVGTIALPGSHHCSELPVHPLALLSSYALNGLAPRPPALSQPSQGPSPCVSQIQTPSTFSPSTSRASSAGPNTRKKVSQKARSKEPTPRLPGPEITLPDPSDQPPANFLRNQSGLLGTAGLVGGIKPAKLSQRHNRGTNPANPIVVEEEDTPTLGRASKFRHPYMPPVDPNLLPTPPIQDVVSTLIGQKDVFPVLENLLRLIASGSPDSHIGTSYFGTDTQRRPVSSATLPVRPTKKRKLNRVPAGAVDWDVPYPFPPGEGPNAYRTTWERQRGKQLLSQLLGLIKSAARKAATKIYYQNGDVMLEAQRAAVQEKVKAAHDEAKIYGHYRPVTTAYGLERQVTTRVPVQEVSTGASSENGGSAVEQTPSSCQTAPGCAASGTRIEYLSTPFDQLISSLLAASPAQGANTSMHMDSGFGDASFNAEASTSRLSGGNVDQGLYDSWMDILQTFPVPSAGFGQSTETQDFGEISTSASIASPNDFGLIDFDFDCDSAVGPAFDSQSWAGISGVDKPLDDFAAMSDHMIDPALLAMSVSQLTPPTVAASPSVSFASSPMSSVETPGPTTPNSANWDISMPEVYTSSSSNGGFDNATGHHRSGLGGQVGGDDYHDALAGDHANVHKQDKGKGRQDIRVLPTSSVQESVPQSVLNPNHAEENIYASTIISPVAPSATSKPSEKSSNKEDILRRANERRAQLRVELDRVRTQLWETTIEQGVLVHLAKH